MKGNVFIMSSNRLLPLEGPIYSYDAGVAGLSWLFRLTVEKSALQVRNRHVDIALCSVQKHPHIMFSLLVMLQHLALVLIAPRLEMATKKSGSLMAFMN